MKYYFIYIAAVNLLLFLLYGIDKHHAKKQKWRIKESRLLTGALLGGCIGALYGMKIFHHKTKHWYFWAVNILALLLYITAAVYIFIYPIVEAYIKSAPR